MPVPFKSDSNMFINVPADGYKSMVSYQKGSTRHAYARQIGPFGQDTIEMNLGHR